MERDAYREIAVKYGKRLGQLEKSQSSLLDKMRPDCRENPANPLTIFSKLRQLRQSIDNEVVIKGQGALRIAQDSVYAYSEATYSIGTIRAIINDASQVNESPLVSSLTDSQMDYCIKRDVIGIFGPDSFMNHFQGQFSAGIAKGRQNVLDELTGDIPLVQYNKASIERLFGLDGKGSVSVKLPTAIEGVEVGYGYGEDNSLPEICIITHPIT